MRDVVREFIPGQRWVSDAELQLGLGTVLAVDDRTVTLIFMATGDTRTYARLSAPLTRVAFAPGDWVPSHEGWRLRVDSVEARQGLLVYRGAREDGTPDALEEGGLDSFVQLNRPVERLFSGQIDQAKWFALRCATLEHANRLSRSEFRGLAGGRTSLIPHQLYIAHEVANRYAPRVLLADEVGLGKTIEAGLILHHQLLTERVRRVLIVVPEHLVHQWLVEMVRRFNLQFSLFDEARCKAVDESGGYDNPFMAEQLVLCGLDFVARGQGRFDQMLAGEWDLMIVDEAHHLEWTPDQTSPQYDRVDRLARVVKGVLLLTATPEQLGKEGHFARLRLLDPERFPDFRQFCADEAQYAPVARTAEALLAGERLDAAATRLLAETVSEGDNEALLDVLAAETAGDEARHRASAELVEHLLDRHGTGRVLFRNTRATIKGFPERRLTTYPLPLPDEYRERLYRLQSAGIGDAGLLLAPEALHRERSPGGRPWTEFDPRLAWLAGTLRSLRPEKVLVITAHAETAMDIGDALRLREGIAVSVFHEQMSILERDRGAAYFADEEYGCQVLVSSEIGSEGRNFQFAHHLVLFDLPINPDLLEQRIGRLDRIGQRHAVEIHLPFMEESAQALMMRWYRDGLNAFEHPCPAGHSVFRQVERPLMDALHHLEQSQEDFGDLIVATRAINADMTRALHAGRDRLLEINSYRPGPAARIAEGIARMESDAALNGYLESVFDCFGIDTEDLGDDVIFVRPGRSMQMGGFPGLREGGMSATLNRERALGREDVQFITWEHPLVSGAMELIRGNEFGNTSVAAIRLTGIEKGSMLMEAVYLLDAVTDGVVQAGRYLPPSLIRVIVDQKGRNLSAAITREMIDRLAQQVEPAIAAKVVRGCDAVLRSMISVGESLAAAEIPGVLSAAREEARRTLTTELNRLRALRLVNPNVREEEIRFYEQQLAAVDTMFDSARLRMDALRLVVII